MSSVRQVNPRYIEYDHRGKYMLDVNASANLTTPDLAAGAQLDNTGADPQILLVSSYVDALGYADADRAVGTTVRIGIADYTGELHEVVATVAGVQNETILASGAALNDALSTNCTLSRASVSRRRRLSSPSSPSRISARTPPKLRSTRSRQPSRTKGSRRPQCRTRSE